MKYAEQGWRKNCAQGIDHTLDDEHLAIYSPMAAGRIVGHDHHAVRSTRAVLPRTGYPKSQRQSVPMDGVYDMR